MSVAEFLSAQVPFLQGLTEEQAGALAVEAEQRSFAAGGTVLFRGTTVDGLYVVAAGRVSVWVKPEKSRTLVQAAELGPGEVFGETSIVEMSTAGATVKAAENDTQVFVIPQEAFREALAQNPDFSARAAALIAERKLRSQAAAAPPVPA